MAAYEKANEKLKAFNDMSEETLNAVMPTMLKHADLIVDLKRRLLAVHRRAK